MTTNETQKNRARQNKFVFSFSHFLLHNRHLYSYFIWSSFVTVFYDQDTTVQVPPQSILQKSKEIFRHNVDQYTSHLPWRVSESIVNHFNQLFSKGGSNNARRIDCYFESGRMNMSIWLQLWLTMTVYLPKNPRERETERRKQINQRKFIRWHGGILKKSEFSW